MSENAIDSENIIKPSPDTAKPKGRAQSWQQGQTKEGAGPFLWHDKINGESGRLPEVSRSPVRPSGTSVFPAGCAPIVRAHGRPARYPKGGMSGVVLACGHRRLRSRGNSVPMVFALATSPRNPATTQKNLDRTAL